MSKGRHGLAIDQIIDKWRAQGYSCLLCKMPIHLLEDVTVDHDHAHCLRSGCNKCVRGILCGPCNSKVGVYETYEKLTGIERRAILEYLLRYSVNK